MSVASLVAIDLVILVTYTLVEGIMGNLAVQQVSNKEQPMKTEGVRTCTEKLVYSHITNLAAHSV